MAGENQVDVAELEKQHAELGEQIVKLGGKVKYPENDDSKLKAKKSVERVRLDKAKAKAQAEDDEEDPEDSDDMLDDESDSAPAKKTKKAADETVEFNGQTIAKSAVGEAQFAIFKSMAAELAKASTDIAKAQDDALTARLEKRADDQYAHVPGSTQERGAMLKAIEKMDEPLRKSFEAVFAQSEKLAKAAFSTVGTSSGDSENIKKSKQDFETKVTEIAKRDNIARAAAMTKARAEHPDLFKAYQDSN